MANNDDLLTDIALIADAVTPSRIESPEARALSERMAAAGYPLTLYGPVVRTSRSTIFLGEHQSDQRLVAVKLCLRDGDTTPAEAAVAGFAAVQRMYEIAASDDLLAGPAPYMVLPEQGVFVSEWVAGRTLHALLRRSASGGQLAIVQASGAWLGRLAMRTSSGRASIRPAEMLAQFDGAALNCAQQRTLDFLRATAPQAAAEPVSFYRCFGDFKPENLMLSRGRLYGIDGIFDHLGPGVADAAQFLNHVALSSPASLLSPRGAAWDERVGAAFLAGYEAVDLGGLPPLPLTWSRLRSALRLYVGFRTWSCPPKSWGASIMLRKLISIQTRRLVDSIQCPSQI